MRDPLKGPMAGKEALMVWFEVEGRRVHVWIGGGEGIDQFRNVPVSLYIFCMTTYLRSTLPRYAGSCYRYNRAGRSTPCRKWY